MHSDDVRMDEDHAVRADRRPVRLLLINPRFSESFWTFRWVLDEIMPGKRAMNPPLGLATLAALCPSGWEVTLVDENVESVPLLPETDIVGICGMAVQFGRQSELLAYYRAKGYFTVAGGSYASLCPEKLEALADTVVSGEAEYVWPRFCRDFEAGAPQPLYAEKGVVSLEDSPTPRFDLLRLDRYHSAAVQFSRGCPYRCEFCDIPALYGRNPRLKTPDQIRREMDSIVRNGARGAVYFVDDNFVGNKKAAHDLLPHLIRWQQDNGYPLRFACEATMNMAQMPDLLAMMREANFRTVFVGIETPETQALTRMDKKQNLRLPILEGVEIFNNHGLEVVSGIIMGLDTDTPETGANILEFIDVSNIPLLTINLLYALPKTPLFDRLKREGRLLPEAVAARRASNVDFLMPYDRVMGMWHDTVTAAYTPEALFRRFRYQTVNTFPKRLPIRPKADWPLIRHGLQVVARTLWHAGAAAEWRSEFWRLCGPLLRQGRVEEVVHIGVVAYHLLTFVDEIKRGRHEAAFYADTSLARREEPQRVTAAA